MQGKTAESEYGNKVKRFALSGPESPTLPRESKFLSPTFAAHKIDKCVILLSWKNPLLTLRVGICYAIRS